MVPPRTRLFFYTDDHILSSVELILISDYCISRLELKKQNGRVHLKAYAEKSGAACEIDADSLTVRDFILKICKSDVR